MDEYSRADWGSEYVHLIKSLPFTTGPVHRYVLPLSRQRFGVDHIVVENFGIGREREGHIIGEELNERPSCDLDIMVDYHWVTGGLRSAAQIISRELSFVTGKLLGESIIVIRQWKNKVERDLSL